MNIHWDYAESFTGRDAAYLIAGFDPSSGSTEDAYRVQPVIRRLKDSYYEACTSLAIFLRGDGEVNAACNWQRLLTFQKKKSQLISAQIENLVSNFKSSEFVTSGQLHQIRSIEDVIAAGFPNQSRINSLREKVSAAENSISSVFNEFDPIKGARYHEVLRLTENIKNNRTRREINSAQFQKAIGALVIECADLSKKAEEYYSERFLAAYEEYKSSKEELEILTFSQHEWEDDRATERLVILKNVKDSFIAADFESEQWARSVHEFDAQKFSRLELQRWIEDNGFPSQYNFTPLRMARKVDGDLPWGAHSTILLEKLSKAAKKFWSNYDPGDATTAPTNETVTAWLVNEGVSKRIAQTMATILRADGLLTGRRG